MNEYWQVAEQVGHKKPKIQLPLSVSYFKKYNYVENGNDCEYLELLRELICEIKTRIEIIEAELEQNRTENE